MIQITILQKRLLDKLISSELVNSLSNPMVTSTNNMPLAQFEPPPPVTSETSTDSKTTTHLIFPTHCHGQGDDPKTSL